MNNKARDIASPQLDRTTKALAARRDKPPEGNQPGLAATRTPVLWLSDAGAVSCTKHLPPVAVDILNKRPTAQQILSQTLTWHRLSRADLSSLRALANHEPKCERCTIEHRWLARHEPGQIP